MMSANGCPQRAVLTRLAIDAVLLDETEHERRGAPRERVHAATEVRSKIPLDVVGACFRPGSPGRRFGPMPPPRLLGFQDHDTGALRREM